MIPDLHLPVPTHAHLLIAHILVVFGSVAVISGILALGQYIIRRRRANELRDAETYARAWADMNAGKISKGTTTDFDWAALQRLRKASK
jgi:hypothetical protein